MKGERSRKVAKHVEKISENGQGKQTGNHNSQDGIRRKKRRNRAERKRKNSGIWEELKRDCQSGVVEANKLQFACCKVIFEAQFQTFNSERTYFTHDTQKINKYKYIKPGGPNSRFPDQRGNSSRLNLKS